MYHGGYKTLINYDRSITPSAVATAVTAYCMDGLSPVTCPNVKQGAAQVAFAGEGRTVWATFLDPLATQPVSIDLSTLPPAWDVRDVMGNDPRRAGNTTAEIGLTPIFVCTSSVPSAEVVRACNDAISIE